MLEEFSGLEHVRLLLHRNSDQKSGSRGRGRHLSRESDLLGVLFDDADTWLSESFIKGIFNRAKAKNPSVKVPDVKVCDWKRQVRWKSWFYIFDHDLRSSASRTVLQRFLDGDFSGMQ